MTFDLLLVAAFLAVCALCVWALSAMSRHDDPLAADTYARMKAMAARGEDKR